MNALVELPTRIRSKDHGRRISEREFFAAEFESGFQFELIDGRVFVSPAPDSPHDNAVEWLRAQIAAYQLLHPGVIQYVSGHCRVYVPGRKLTTCPEPDLALFSVYPRRFPRMKRSWKDVSPMVVIEVAGGNLDKDLVRNTKLYLEVPTVREYWVVIDGESDPDVTFRVFRRRGATRWQTPIDIVYGGTYSTPVLPGFRMTFRPD